MAIKDLAPWTWGKRRLSPLMEEGHPLLALQRQMNSIMDEFMSGLGMEPFSMKGFTPRISASEDREKVYVTAELPGLTEKDIEVTLTKEELIIRGEKKAEFEEEGRDMLRAERSYGCFQRVIPLGVEVNEDAVDAVFKDGVLSVTLTKTAESQKKAKKIPIRP